MLDALAQAFATIAQPDVFVFLLAGVALGLAVGILPGLGGSTGLALLLPFVYGMEPAAGIALMIGVLSVISTADTFPAVLVGIPGSVSGQATVMDGYPLAQQGRGGEALAAAFSSSLVGGIVGAVALTLIVIIAEPLLLSFGTGEMLMLAVLGVTMVGILTGPSWAKGLVSALLGLVLGTVGIAPASSEYRLDFGNLYLSDGLPLVVVAIAIFAVPEITDLLRRDQSVAENAPDRQSRVAGMVAGLRAALRHRWLVVRSSALGTAIGMLPGLGGAVVDWIAYAQAIQTAPDKERFGHGDIRGVIAPESANNAKEGGALVPTLIFGIPGSASTAILIGGLILLGVEPGIQLVQRDLDLVYTIIWSLALANIVGAGACILLSGQIAKLTRVRFALIAPFMIVLLFFAAFQSTQSWGDLVVLVAVGALAMLMRRFGYPRSALMIGFVLALPLEINAYQTYEFYGLNVFTRPVFLAILALCAASVWSGVRLVKSQREGAKTRLHTTSRAQQVFIAGLALATLATMASLSQLRLLGSVFPLGLCVGLLALLAYLFVPTRRTEAHVNLKDTEMLQVPGQAPGMWRPLGWVVLPALISVVTGFWLATGVFVASFLRVKARLSWVAALIAALATMAFLWAIGSLLNMSFPEGLLQQVVPLRYPLG